MNEQFIFDKLSCGQIGAREALNLLAEKETGDVGRLLMKIADRVTTPPPRKDPYFGSGRTDETPRLQPSTTEILRLIDAGELNSEGDNSWRYGQPRRV